MALPNIPQAEALVPMAPVNPVPFPEDVPEEFFVGLSFQDRRFLMHYLEWGNATLAYAHACQRKPEGIRKRRSRGAISTCVSPGYMPR